MKYRLIKKKKSECQKLDWNKHSSRVCSKPSVKVGLPFVIRFKKSQIEAENFENCLRKSLLEQSLKSVELFNFDLSKKNIFELEIVEKSATVVKIDNSFRKLVELFQNSLKTRRVIFKANLRWNNNQSIYNEISLKTDLSRIKDLRRIDQNIGVNQSVCLDECLNLFTQPEKLTSDNPWYCSKCKKHQEATKQMNLWKLPKYLIITLKRFQASKASDNFLNTTDETARLMMMNSRFSYLMQNRVVYNKLNTFVKFPLK